MKIQVVVFWVMTLCSDVVGNQRFGGPSSFIFIIRRHNPENHDLIN